MKKLLSALLMMFAFSAVAGDVKQESDWTNDLAAAKAKAEKDGKDILLLFVGSDWCAVCKALMKELEKDAVKKAISDHYIPVVIDFPQKFKLPEKIALQNRDLSIQFGIGGVPVIVALDVKGKAFGNLTGFDDKTSILEILDLFQKAKAKRDEAMKAADKLEGAAKAKAYNDLMLAMVGDGGVFTNWSDYGYEAEIDMIMKADPDNKAGMKICWDFRRTVRTAREAYNIDKDAKKAMKILDDFAAAYPDNKELRQKTLWAKAQLQGITNDIAGLMVTLQQIVNVDPDSEIGQHAKQAIAELAKEIFSGGQKDDEAPPAEEKKDEKK